MEDKQDLLIEYAPAELDEKCTLQLLTMTGLSKQKYLVIPNEYFSIEEHVLLDGITLIPMRNLYEE